MNAADVQYNKVIREIIEYGYNDYDTEVRTVWADGTPAHSKFLISRQFRFDNTEIPIITTKAVAWKTAIKELLWIWQMKSNKVQDLRDMGVNIWNEWEQEDGTIGKAYGAQFGKKNRLVDEKYVDQVEYLIHQLKTNPSSRRHITMLWNPDDLDEMSLTPCVYETQWYVVGNKLHLEVRARSNDMMVGNPFNVFQYNVLQRIIAQVTGYELGEYIYNMGNTHVYTRHFPNALIQTTREQYKPPTLWINPEVTKLEDFTIDDFKLIGYEHGDKLFYEVAI